MAREYLVTFNVKLRHETSAAHYVRVIYIGAPEVIGPVLKPRFGQAVQRILINSGVDGERGPSSDCLIVADAEATVKEIDELLARAHHYREMAGQITDQKAHDALLELAEEYERQASTFNQKPCPQARPVDPGSYRG